MTEHATPEQSATGRGRHAENVREIPRRGWKDVAGRVVREFEEDKVVLLSAGVAFFFFLALIPALAAFISIYALVSDPSDVIQQAQRVLSGFPPQISEFMSSQLQLIAAQTGQALGWSAFAGIALSLWSASAGTARLIEAVNVAYDERDDRGLLHRRGVAFIWTVGLIILAIAGLILGNWALSALRNLTASVGIAATIGFWIGVALIMAAGLAVLYRYAPYRADPKWRWISWGSLLAAVLWVAATVGFQLYLSNFSAYNQIYGSLGAVLIFMVWLLMTALVIILGAELNSELEHQTRTDTTVGPDRAMGERDAVVADTLGDRIESLRPGKEGSSSPGDR